MYSVCVQDSIQNLLGECKDIVGEPDEATLIEEH